MSTPKLLNTTTMLAFVFVFSMTTLDVILSYMGWKPTFGDDLLAGVIGFLPSVGSVALSMLIGVTHSWKTKILSSIIWLFCITISLTGNFLNMTARAFESLDQENKVKVEVSNIKDTNKEKLNIFKDVNKEQLDLFDGEIAELTAQYEKARENRDFQINDGVNSDGSMGPKARAFQAAMDELTISIEKKREQKRELQAQSAKALLEFQAESLETLSEANVELAETQNDMRGHMPVIRYFIPSKEGQRQAVLWGLGLFAAVISLAGPVVSYAMAVHLNHKRLSSNTKKKLAEEELEEKRDEDDVSELLKDIVDELSDIDESIEELARQKALAEEQDDERLKNLGYR